MEQKRHKNTAEDGQSGIGLESDWNRFRSFRILDSDSDSWFSEKSIPIPIPGFWKRSIPIPIPGFWKRPIPIPIPILESDPESDPDSTPIPESQSTSRYLPTYLYLTWG